MNNENDRKLYDTRRITMYNILKMKRKLLIIILVILIAGIGKVYGEGAEIEKQNATYGNYNKRRNRNEKEGKESEGDGGNKIEREDEGMVLIEGGEFIMGEDGGEGDESPEHRVELSTFWIGKYEVTNEKYCDFLNERGNKKEEKYLWMNEYDKDCGIKIENGMYRPKKGREREPAVEVTWFGAQAFCRWKGGRLPTEAEWEAAARGGLESKKYPWGDEVESENANYNHTGEWKKHRLKEVGKYPPNGYGLYDTCGNAWEWVFDWYKEDYYRFSPGADPKGPEDGKQKCVRGGCWADVPDKVRTANRAKFKPTNQRGYLGFRCVIPANAGISLEVNEFRNENK